MILQEKGWFNATVRFAKTLDNGKTKNVTENFVFNGNSYSEAESIVEHMIETAGIDDAMVKGIKRVDYDDVVKAPGADADEKFWFSCKTSYTDADEKVIKLQYLVQADTLTDAATRLENGILPETVDADLLKIEKTNVTSVYKQE